MPNTIDKDIKNLPQLPIDEWEIVTIGNEGRCGESVLVHLPNGKWLIIDSCVTNLYKRDKSDTFKKQSLPLLYLEWRSQKMEDVETIVCTHWHKDHCEGMSQLLFECEKANFVHAKHSKDFIEEYFGILGANIKAGAIDDESEFRQCMSLIATNGTNRRSQYATMDKIISRDFDIATLSPTDVNSDEYDISILRQYGVKGYHALKDPNTTSISLSIRHNDRAMLFGADLSITKPPRKERGSDSIDFNEREKNNLNAILESCKQCPFGEDGWCYVCHRSVLIGRNPKYEYIKIPHHSSSTGYCKKLYMDYLSSKAIGVSTTYSPSQLPSKTMLEQLKTHLSEIYVTDKSASTIEDQIIDSRIRNYLDSLGGVHFVERSKEIGIIVSNFRNGKWETKCFGNAYAEKKSYMSKITKFIFSIVR